MSADHPGEDDRYERSLHKNPERKYAPDSFYIAAVYSCNRAVSAIFRTMIPLSGFYCVYVAVALPTTDNNTNKHLYTGNPFYF